MPSVFVKCVPLRPMRWASRFIIATKPSSEPPTASASASAASLPDWTIRPISRSCTLTGLLGSMNMRDSSLFTFSTTLVGTTVWSSVRRFSLIAWKAR
ncbi:hypothetical protein D3C81_1385060 [compost metagenome]